MVRPMAHRAKGSITRPGRLAGGLVSLDLRPLRSLVADTLSAEGTERVLEVGCTPASVGPRLLQGVRELVLLDPDPEHIRWGRRRHRRALARGELTIEPAAPEALPFRSGAFAAACTIGPLLPLRRSELREVRRVLAPGGRFVLGSTPPRGWVGEGRLTRLHRELRRAGFRRVRTELGETDVLTLAEA